MNFKIIRQIEELKKKDNKITILEVLKFIYEIFTNNLLFWQHS